MLRETFEMTLQRQGTKVARGPGVLMSILHDNFSLPSGMNNKDCIIMTVTVINRFNEE